MISYLNDPVGTDEWELRHTVLRLHDTATRIKLLRGFGGSADDLRAGREELKAKLLSLPLFAALPEQRRARILTGEEMFTTGMRGVAIKKMGWDEDQFTAIYAYLSAHAHSAPVSFMRMREHQIDYMAPSETQMETLAISMQVAISCLRRVLVRQIDLQPDQVGEYQPDLLAEARTEDAACPFFNRRPVSISRQPDAGAPIPPAVPIDLGRVTGKQP
ncbi:hypothetical protein E1H18_4788 [Caulobacter sp. RHG1]|nr:hypothetical protein [Caulobacter sp. RHG1]